MNGVENLHQRFNGQRQAKNNQRLVTCFTLKEQWRLSINSLLLFGFDAHEMINLIENVAPENNKTDWSYAWQEVSHVEHHRWIKRSSSCPRSLKGIINIRLSIFALQLQSTPFIFGNQLNEDFLKKIGGNQYTFIWHKPIRSQLRTNIRLINWNNRRKAKVAAITITLQIKWPIYHHAV